MPYPKPRLRGEARSARLDILRKLHSATDDVPAAIAKSLPEVKDGQQRAELVEALRDLPAKPRAGDLVTTLSDPSSEVRGNAITCLAAFARKVDRFGPRAEQRSPEASPRLRPCRNR